MSAARIVDLAANSSNMLPAKRRGRKRRQTIDTPCPDCIQRASESTSRGDVRMCVDCARTIGSALKPITKLAVKSSSISKRYRTEATRTDYEGQNASVLRTTAYTVDEAIPPPGAGVDYRSAKEKLIELPPVFSNLHDAYRALQPVHNRLAALIMNVESATDSVVTPFSQDNYRLRASQWLRTWDTAFAQFLAESITYLSLDERKAALTLKAHHLIAKCFASAQLIEAQFDWSAFTFEFEAILNLASEVMKANQAGHTGNIHHGSQSILPKITILDPVFEVRIRTTNATLADWATQLQTTIQMAQPVATPKQSFHAVHTGLQEVSHLAAVKTVPLQLLSQSR